MHPAVQIAGERLNQRMYISTCSL